MSNPGNHNLLDYFRIVDVADLHHAIRTITTFIQREVPGKDVAEIEELWHSANVLSTFQDALEANAEQIETAVETLAY